MLSVTTNGSRGESVIRTSTAEKVFWGEKSKGSGSLYEVEPIYMVEVNGA